MQYIEASLLGSISLKAGEKTIAESGSRQKKSWLLLAYLICHRGKPVSQKKLIELLWGDDASISKPENSLRITLHRLRSQLDALWDGAGHDIIVSADGGYCINEALSISCDYERFEALCRFESDDADALLSARLEALDMYKGDFVEKYSSELWTIALSTHFRNYFISTTVKAAEQLAQAGRYEEAAERCRKALGMEPYHEELVRLLMLSLHAMGDSNAVTAVYENFSKRLFNDFGIHISDELRKFYRDNVISPGKKQLMMDEIMEYLREDSSLPGAFECGYDQFKLTCQVESRAIERNGRATHIALISIMPKADKAMSKKAMDEIAELFFEQLRSNLRRGDIISKCSSTQFVVMLPNANYENSCMVCRRIIAAFFRLYPHIAVDMRYIVQPLSPSISMP